MLAVAPTSTPNSWDSRFFSHSTGELVNTILVNAECIPWNYVTKCGQYQISLPPPDFLWSSFLASREIALPPSSPSVTAFPYFPDPELQPHWLCVIPAATLTVASSPKSQFSLPSRFTPCVRVVASWPLPIHPAYTPVCSALLLPLRSLSSRHSPIEVLRLCLMGASCSEPAEREREKERCRLQPPPTQSKGPE